ncbi:PIG-L deacetylase family protein [Vibrio hyugaensis]|uniref:PIG-L deacetylase family protein n=1 Tax=Vibrio hyugaensis TaxID=1534743 RepID=UPI000CE5460E|nr:PIG-L deacetylase family protein [Vibrio hyugaensis]
MLDNIQSAVCVVAHPDDAEIGLFSTLEYLSMQSVPLHLIVMTGGSLGFAVQSNKQDNLRQIRKFELESAFSDINISLHYMDHQENSLSNNNHHISSLEKLILKLNCDTVFTHAGDNKYCDHQNHLAVSKIVTNICARKDFIRNLIYFSPVNGMASFSPNLFLYYSNALERKHSAISKHQSQHGRYYMNKNFLKESNIINRSRSNFSGLDVDKDILESFQLVFSKVANV